MNEETYGALKRVVFETKMLLANKFMHRKRLNKSEVFYKATLTRDLQAIINWIDEVAKEYEEILPDEISSKWHVDDVKSLDETLTDDEAREVLQRAEENFDASLGINWDVLQFHIDEIIKKRDTKGGCPKCRSKNIGGNGDNTWSCFDCEHNWNEWTEF